MKKAIIIGASSGIGRELAQVFSKNDYEVGLVSRRIELLNELQKKIKVKTYVKEIDITQTDDAITKVQSLIEEMGNIDVFVINSGVCINNPELDWKKDEKTISVNVLGFTAMANTALSYFLKKNNGHLIGISSVSALRGESYTPAYSASKAWFVKIAPRWLVNRIESRCGQSIR